MDFDGASVSYNCVDIKLDAAKTTELALLSWPSEHGKCHIVINRMLRLSEIMSQRVRELGRH
jgi:hypothetical protein